MNLIKKINKTALAFEDRHWFFLFSFLYRLILELSYFKFMVPIFAYDGYVFEFDGFKYIESWLIFSSMIFISPNILYKPSDYLVNIMLFSFLTPLLVMYSFSDANREALYIVFMAVALIFFFRHGKPLHLPRVRTTLSLVYFILLVGIVVVTAWMFFSGGFKYFNLDLTLVYEYRSEVGEIINQGLMGYLNIWATKVFGPILLALTLWRKKYLLAGFVFGLHVLWFGISSHKSVLFYPFLIIFLWGWFRKTRALSLIPLSMAFAVLFAFILYTVYEEIFIGSLFIRRTFFVPAKLTFVYYEFFSINPFVYWSNSIASAFVDYPYSVPTALLIGNHLGSDGNANNSFLSTGYMHAGVLGMIFYGILVGLLLRLIDSLARDGAPVWVAVAVILVPSHSLLISADLPTALLTHGVGISLVMLFLLRSAFRKATQTKFSLPATNHRKATALTP